MSDAPVRILGFAGSLRRASFNRALLRVAVSLAPADAVIETFDLIPIPPFNEDVRVAGEPAAVTEFKARVRAADGLLIVTPEYNYSIPGVLKNAIDWLSRPPAESPLKAKPAAILGASNGGFGTVRSQLHLRQVLLGSGMHGMPGPELMVSRAQDKFDAEGNLTDEKTRDGVRAVVTALVAFARSEAAARR